MMVLSLRNMLFRVCTKERRVCSRLAGFRSHSHTVMQCQPISASLFCSSLSRSMFLVIFFTQNSLFVFGILQHSELSTSEVTLCPCQKHPFTNMPVWYRLSTMSGCPGNLLWFSRYLNPLLHRYRLTTISGLVSLERIATMLLCLCMGEWLSGIFQVISGTKRFRLSLELVLVFFSQWNNKAIAAIRCPLHLPNLSTYLVNQQEIVNIPCRVQSKSSILFLVR